MSVRYDFEKYEGLGNDFLVIEAHREQLHEHAPAICDRHFGVGADGVLLVTPPQSSGARATMTVLNADGSRPEMCGNGLRCVALHLARRDSAASISYVVDTEAGPLACEVEMEHARLAQVSTALGQGRPQPDHVAKLPDRAPGESATGGELAFKRISMGNPHAILFGDLPSLELIDDWGPKVSAAFPDGSNVEFAKQRDPSSFDLIVWERGVGRTLACGTGAAATAVAAVLTERAAYDQPLTIHLPGGPLEVRVNKELFVRARGPARHIFSGSVEVP